MAAERKASCEAALTLVGPPPGHDSLGSAVVKVLAGRELGIGPFTAMSDIHIVDGTPWSARASSPRWCASRRSTTTASSSGPTSAARTTPNRHGELEPT